MYRYQILHQKRNEALTTVDNYKELPSRTLATILFQEFPHLFKSVETARNYVRSLRGASGDYKRKHCKTNIMEKKISTISEGLAKLKAYQETKAESIILTDCEILLLGDIHIPFHHTESLTAAIEYGLTRNPDVIILNGDIIDCYDVSSFTKEIERPRIEDEIQACVEFLTLLRDAFPKARIIYKLGNHEERMRNYILKNAQAFSGLSVLRLENLLNLDALNIEVVHREIIKAGNLNILHGHEMGESIFSPVNPARGFFLKAKTDTIVNHYHQVSHHSEGNLNGISIGVWSVGCLCMLNPAYRPFAFTKWKHGFAYITVYKDGQFMVENKEIKNGQIY